MLKIMHLGTYGWEAAIRDHPGFKATRDGQIIGKRGKPLIGCVGRCGYKEVLLSENGKTKRYLVHRLILSTFEPIENEKNFDVNHKDGNKLNNNISNLEWCTRSENIKHSYRNGLQKNVSNQYGSFRVLSERDLSIIKNARELGYTTDAQVAKLIGCSRELVGRKRREMGL